MTDAERIQKLTDALDWYAAQARLLKAYVLEIDRNRMMQVVSEVALDNGNRAREAKE